MLFLSDIKRLFTGKRLLPALILMVSTTFLMGITSAATCTYLIYDGLSPRIIQTTLRDTEQALKLAGLETGVHDVVEGPTTAEDGFADIRIERAFKVHVFVDGRVLSLHSTGETVQSLVSRAGITLGNSDEITPSLAAPLSESAAVRIVRNTSRFEEAYEPIPFEHISIPSRKIDYGKSVVRQQGVPGKELLTFEVFEREGREIARHVLSRQTVEPPVAQISEVGAGGTVKDRDGKIYRFSKYIDVVATAYTTETSEHKHTAIGTVARVGAIAVDPKVIPLRSRIYVCSPDGKRWVYGIAVAEDTGSSIKGDRIDLFFDTEQECLSFGVRKARVYIIQ